MPAFQGCEPPQRNPSPAGLKPPLPGSALPRGKSAAWKAGVGESRTLRAYDPPRLHENVGLIPVVQTPACPPSSPATMPCFPVFFLPLPWVCTRLGQRDAVGHEADQERMLLRLRAAERLPLPGFCEPGQVAARVRRAKVARALLRDARGHPRAAGGRARSLPEVRALRAPGAVPDAAEVPPRGSRTPRHMCRARRRTCPRSWHFPAGRSGPRGSAYVSRQADSSPGGRFPRLGCLVRRRRALAFVEPVLEHCTWAQLTVPSSVQVQSV